MMEMSEQPIAVYTDAKLRSVVKDRGWRIILLYEYYDTNNALFKIPAGKCEN
jgi:hypothetical protein